MLLYYYYYYYYYCYYYYYYCYYYYYYYYYHYYIIIIILLLLLLLFSYHCDHHNTYHCVYHNYFPIAIFVTLTYVTSLMLIAWLTPQDTDSIDVVASVINAVPGAHLGAVLPISQRVTHCGERNGKTQISVVKNIIKIIKI